MRKLAALALALCVTLYPARHKYAEAPSYTNAQLQDWYGTYNDIYFNGHLPKDTVVQWGNVWGNNSCGETSHGGKAITLDRHCHRTQSQTLLTLQHEMCHVATMDEFDEHGQRWLDCMHRLAADGAMDKLW